MTVSGGICVSGETADRSWWFDKLTMREMDGLQGKLPALQRSPAMNVAEYSSLQSLLSLMVSLLSLLKGEPRTTTHASLPNRAHGFPNGKRCRAMLDARNTPLYRP
jgi:hypothetical protein